MVTRETAMREICSINFQADQLPPVFPPNMWHIALSSISEQFSLPNMCNVALPSIAPQFSKHESLNSFPSNYDARCPPSVSLAPLLCLFPFIGGGSSAQVIWDPKNIWSISFTNSVFLVSNSKADFQGCKMFEKV